MQRNNFNYSIASENQPRSSGRGWTLCDVFMALSVISTVFAIPELRPLPISPAVFFPFAFFISAIRSIFPRIKPIFSVSSFTVFFAVMVTQSSMILVDDGLNYEPIARIGRLVSGVLFAIALIAYVNSSEVRMKRVVSLSILTIGLSLFWFLLEISIVEPFVSARLKLYDPIYAVVKEGSSTAYRSGLVPFPHFLGYQLAFFLPLVILLPITGNRIYAGTLRFILVSLGLVALYYSSQRSALAALAVDLFLFFTISRSFAKPTRVVFAILIAAVVSSIFVTGELLVRDDTETTVLFKLSSISYWEEALFRVQLQLKAIELVFVHPLGLPFAGLTWDTAGFWPVYYNSPFLGATSAIAVHNGYLQMPLDLGLAVLILIGWFLYAMLRSGIAIIRVQYSEISSTSYATFANTIAAATIGLFFAQSSAHNPSLFTMDASCIICFSMFVSIEIDRRSRIRQAKMAQSVRLNSSQKLFTSIPPQFS